MRRLGLGEENRVGRGGEGIHGLLLPLELFPPLHHWGSSMLAIVPPTVRG